MVTASRIEGLKLGEQRFSIKADPVVCKLDVGGLQIGLVDIDMAWSAIFDLAPTASTWLTSSVTNVTNGIDVSVASTEGFPSSGYIWIDGETMSYTSTTATTFVNCTRGALSDDSDAAQYHYITDGVRLRNPEVTNWPVLWEGRRVNVYRYDDGDSPTGSGTQIYRGVITTGPRFDGTTWTLGVDHMISVLEQMFGEDLTEPLTPRGIHYTTLAPLVLNWAQHTAGSYADLRQGGVNLVGFYENQGTFCQALTTALATSFSVQGGSGTLTAIPDGASGWHLKYTTASPAHECAIQILSGAAGVQLGAPIDPGLGALQGTPVASVPPPAPVPPFDWGYTQLANGLPYADIYGNNLAANTDYFFFRPMNGFEGQVNTPLGSVPRGTWCYNDNTDGRTIYLSGAGPLPSTVTSVSIKGTDPATGNEYTETYQVSSVDTANRAIVIQTFHQSAHQFLSDKLPEIRLGMNLQTATPPTGSSVADLLDFVAAGSQQYATLGVMPSLRALDFNASAWHAIFDSLPPLNTQRLFVTFSPISVMDIVREELKAAGCFLTLDSIGRLVPARLRIPAQSELSAVATIDSTTLLTDRARVSHEVSGLGQINQITYKTGFNPLTGDFDGDTFTVRDVSAFGQSSSTRAMEIAQKSQYIWSDYQPVDQPTVLLNVGSPIFGALAGEYAIDTIDAAKSDSVQCGDPIVFDCPYLVSEAGTTTPTASLGVLGRVGIVLGKEWPAYESRVRFTVLNTKQSIAGYAPAGVVSSYALVSGNTYDLTLATTYFPSGTTAASFFAASDLVEIAKFNATSSGVLAGTAVSAASNVVRVTFVGAWTPGTDTWYLTIGTASAILSTQMRFCEVADANGVIATGGANLAPARVFAP